MMEDFIRMAAITTGAAVWAALAIGLLAWAFGLIKVHYSKTWED